MAGGAETPNIAALPAIARLGACESARGPDADRHVKLLIQFAVEEADSGAYSQRYQRRPLFFLVEAGRVSWPHASHWRSGGDRDPRISRMSLCRIPSPHPRLCEQRQLQ
jgi:hypothetical protein